MKQQIVKCRCGCAVWATERHEKTQLFRHEGLYSGFSAWATERCEAADLMKRAGALVMDLRRAMIVASPDSITAWAVARIQRGPVAAIGSPAQRAMLLPVADALVGQRISLLTFADEPGALAWAHRQAELWGRGLADCARTQPSS